ncbi:alpha/beta fold hydrolase, partial [Pseudomonas viridiflava]|uniref:alpha/beta fold hydrolase n=1 Tax=Pseudomonas viridiflava TaxID=33069 RepID=UPI003C6DE911
STVAVSARDKRQQILVQLLRVSHGKAMRCAWIDVQSATLDLVISDFANTFYGINHGQQVSESVLTQTLNIALLASLKGTLDCVTAFSATDLRAEMAKIDVPTLVIHGDD